MIVVAARISFFQFAKKENYKKTKKANTKPKK